MANKANKLDVNQRLDDLLLMSPELRKLYDNVYFNVFNRLPDSTSMNRKRERNIELQKGLIERERAIRNAPQQKTKGNPIDADAIVKRIYERLFNQVAPSQTTESDPLTRTIYTQTKPKRQQITRNASRQILLDSNKEDDLMNLDIELLTKRYTKESFDRVVDRTFTEFQEKVGLQEGFESNEDLIAKLKARIAELERIDQASDVEVQQLTEQLEEAERQRQGLVDTFEDTLRQLSEEPPQPVVAVGPVQEVDFFLEMKKIQNEGKLTKWNKDASGDFQSLDWGAITNAFNQYLLTEKDKIETVNGVTSDIQQRSYQRYMTYVLGLFKGYNVRPTPELIQRLARWIRDYMIAKYSTEDDGFRSDHWKINIAQFKDLPEFLADKTLTEEQELRNIEGELEFSKTPLNWGQILSDSQGQRRQNIKTALKYRGKLDPWEKFMWDLANSKLTPGSFTAFPNVPNNINVTSPSNVIKTISERKWDNCVLPLFFRTNGSFNSTKFGNSSNTTRIFTYLNQVGPTAVWIDMWKDGKTKYVELLGNSFPELKSAYTRKQQWGKNENVTI